MGGPAMKKHLFVFCFETPDQVQTNPVYGWDDKETVAFFIKSESEEAALHWGRKAAKEYVRTLFEREGASALHDWKHWAYAHWVDPNPGAILSPPELDRLPIIRIGQFLDFPGPGSQPSLRLAADRRPAIAR